VDEVRRLRLEKGWSQNELAYHAKLAPSVISLIETGKRDPNATTLRKLANALEVRIPDLFEERGSGKAQRRSSPEPTFNDVLDDERRLALMKSLEDEIRYFTARWQEQLKNAQDEDRYWHASVQLIASGYSDILLRRDLLRRVHGIGKLSKQDQHQKFIEDRSDPEFQAAMHLMEAWAYMSTAADEVEEAADALWGDWVIREEAEQRRATFRLIQEKRSA
jgi:transcriptional regulator with XRE-family HTH domain